MRRLIIGCGYLGSRVANLWQNQQDTVFAVTRSAERAREFESRGWVPVVADVTDMQSLQSLPQVDTVLVAVGMDRSRYSSIREVYVDGLKNLLESIPRHSDGQLIYISSTGVYGDFQGDWVDEQSPTEPSREGGRACLEAEQLLQSSEWGRQSTILRFAGIYGPGRIPTRNTIQDKRWQQLTPEGYLNLIHVADGARWIQNLAERSPTGETFLVSDGSPVLRKDYYDFLAESLNLPPIDWSLPRQRTPGSRGNSSKRICNAKLMERHPLQLEFPNYRAGIANAVQPAKESN